MKKIHKFLQNFKFIFFFLLFFLFQNDAYAYLDPGTGSAIVYALVAFVTSLVSFSKKVLSLNSMSLLQAIIQL